MCGRFTLKTSPADLMRAFGLLEPPPDLGARYNIAPSLDILAIPNRGPRHAEVFRWGLVPSWAKDPSIGHKLSNARAESALEKPSFRQALHKRRCLVPVDGFYEWRTEGKRKTPFYFSRHDGQPLALAGLWEVWRPPLAANDEGPRDPQRSLDANGRLWSVCLLTTDANAVVADLHDRMPVVVQPADFERWLDPALDGAAVRELLRPLPAELLGAREVSRFVNNARNEGPQCLESGQDDRLF